MNYTGINWEGGLIGPETLENLKENGDLKGQASSDFELDTPVRDEIQSCWADSVQQWKIFKTRIEREDAKDKYGTSRTRQFWIQPLLALLGFDIETSNAIQIGEKSFAISHKATRRICPIHIIGYYESLDKAREGQKKSPHSMVQEFLNLNEEALFALVTNGHVIRLLRDSSHLVKLTYLEFDLEKIFEEELYDNFAILFRLLHATRFPANETEPSECLLEYYHQNSLENGTRIRDKLSSAVKEAVRLWADGILHNPENAAFVQNYEKTWTADNLNEEFLTLIYRLLFLLVIEERHLVYEKNADQKKRALYYSYYSLQNLRKRCAFMGSEERHYHDAFEQLKTTFALFEDESTGIPLGIKALAGDLFSKNGLELLKGVYINNKDFSDGFRLFDSYYDDKRRVTVRVNYAALNVEEFGSIYEGLLAFDPSITKSINGTYDFSYVEGTDRDDSSSHYTPEELVEPLIKSALEPLIQKKLQEEDKEKALLSIRVCDDACGSGHILLNAARRIALELARVRTNSDNPDPKTYRLAEKDVIRSCIYGIDKNPQAVHLCKVALWLESHNPGTSLGFLDNHIKCGDSLVGVARVEELFDLIPSAMFKTYKDSQKEYYNELKKKNDIQIKDIKIIEKAKMTRPKINSDIMDVIKKLIEVGAMDDTTPEKETLKKQEYQKLLTTAAWAKLKALADLRLAGFFADKTQEHPLVTQYSYEDLIAGNTKIEGNMAVNYAAEVSNKKHFFHWFLEFAEVMAEGGFDCFLGNPPFKGNRRLKGIFGEDYLDYMKIAFAPAGAIDLVGYFVRRNYDLLKKDCSLASLSTNTIAQGNCREGCLQVIEDNGGTITMAVKSTPWPGVAAVSISLLAITKGRWNGTKLLDGKKVEYISTYFDEAEKESDSESLTLAQNNSFSFVGTFVLGIGFTLTQDEVKSLIATNTNNEKVVVPYINGVDLNSSYNQSASRWIINFYDRPLSRETAPVEYNGEFAEDYPECLKIVEEKVKPERTRLNDKGTDFALRKPLPQRWWQYADKRPALYSKLATMQRTLVVAQVSKTLAFAFVDTKQVLDAKLIVFPFQNNFYLTIMQSSLHFYWAWKFCTTMKADLTYTPSAIFETFPFPAGFEPNRDYVTAAVREKEDSSEEIKQHKEKLDALGQKLDEQRKKIMLRLKIGLTKLYNLYHLENLSAKEVISAAKCSEEEASWAINEIQIMRAIQTECDTAVAAAYGWSDIILNHGFYDLEFLPENDRRRYTVCPEARKEIMRRLIALNNTRHQQEVEAGFVDENGKLVKKDSGKDKKAEKKIDANIQPSLFD